jgi:hypothetical protein
MSRSDPIPVECLPDPPWHRAHDEKDTSETDAAYQAFTTYRDMGLARSTAKVARVLGKSKTLMDRWSARWRWRMRVEAWDNDLDLERRVRMNDAIREMAERQASQAQTAVQALMAPHLALAQKLEDGGDDLLRALSKSDIKTLIGMAAKSATALTRVMQAERLARGEPTEIRHVDYTGRVASANIVADDPEKFDEIMGVLLDSGYLDRYASSDDDAETPDSEAAPT